MSGYSRPTVPYSPYGTYAAAQPVSGSATSGSPPAPQQQFSYGAPPAQYAPMYQQQQPHSQHEQYNPQVHQQPFQPTRMTSYPQPQYPPQAPGYQSQLQPSLQHVHHSQLGQPPPHMRPQGPSHPYIGGAYGVPPPQHAHATADSGWYAGGGNGSSGATGAVGSIGGVSVPSAVGRTPGTRYGGPMSAGGVAGQAAQAQASMGSMGSMGMSYGMHGGHQLTDTRALAGQAREAFLRADRDGSGFLDLKEFMDVLRDLGISMGYHEALSRFGSCDADKDGRLGINEFIKMYAEELRDLGGGRPGRR